jgi:hypothetical protein
MIANHFPPPVDLAQLDMDEVDRRIGRRPFARERRSTNLASEGHQHHQDTGQAAAKAPHNAKEP